MTRRVWTREELILAINLYCKTSFGRIHHRNPEIIQLAEKIERTPSAVAWKLSNFASFDKELQNRGIKGAQNASKLDKEIWNEFSNDWDKLVFESETLTDEDTQLETKVLEKEGVDKFTFTKSRINQNFFRKTLLASYNSTCCITGINTPELLVAGHILPWSQSHKNRLNPHNGILINSLHDKAFEIGLITITPEYRIKVSSKIEEYNKEWSLDFFMKYDGNEILYPSRFFPDKEFLKAHNEERFII